MVERALNPFNALFFGHGAAERVKLVGLLAQRARHAPVVGAEVAALAARDVALLAYLAALEALQEDADAGTADEGERVQAARVAQRFGDLPGNVARAEVHADAHVAVVEAAEQTVLECVHRCDMTSISVDSLDL